MCAAGPAARASVDREERFVPGALAHLTAGRVRVVGVLRRAGGWIADPLHELLDGARVHLWALPALDGDVVVDHPVDSRVPPVEGVLADSRHLCEEPAYHADLALERGAIRVRAQAESPDADVLAHGRSPCS